MIKRYKIIWSPKALRDLDNIHFYIDYCLKEKHIANNIVRKLLNLVESLSYLPEKYEKMKSVPIRKNVRRASVKNYAVIYEVDKNTRTSIHFTYFSF